MLESLETVENISTNAWDGPQDRIEMRPYTPLYELDAMEKETLKEFLDGPQVEIIYDLNDDTDYAVKFMRNNSVVTARVSECVTINGVRWHLLPGKNIIPKAVYEFLIQCPEQRRKLSCPQPGESRNLGVFTPSNR